MRSIFGQLSFVTIVHVGDTQRFKKVRLHSVWCEREECGERLEIFRLGNKQIPSDQIHAVFTFTEIIS